MSEKTWEKLLRPRTVFAFMLHLTFCKLAWTGKIEPQYVVNIILIITAFFFGEKIGKSKITEVK